METPVFKKRTLSSTITAEARGVPTALRVESVAEADQPIFRMVVGRDQAPVVMSKAQLEDLGDPFAVLILRRGERPQTVDRLLSRIDAHSHNPELSQHALPITESFLVGEGGQIQYNDDTATVARALRLVVARTNMARDQLIMLSIDDQPESEIGLLQVLSWDPEKRTYNFYQRKDALWFYVGDSYDAIDPPTRGVGPFDGHVNGSLVMKELRRPWIHWQSQSASIPPEAFETNHPILRHPLYTMVQGAEVLERDYVVPGIDRWTEARLSRHLVNGRLERANTFLRQIVETTTVNLVSSDREWSEVASGVDVNVPYEILLNIEAWTDHRLLKPLTIRGRVKIDGGHLRDAVETLGVALVDPQSGYRKSGEAFFALACPSPAYEDISVVFALMSQNILSPSLVRAILAVDFCNPIQSTARASLAAHMPMSGTTGSAAESIEAQFISNLEKAAALKPNGVEQLVLSRLSLGDDAQQAKQTGEEIVAYIEAVKQRYATAEGVLDLVRLVDSRRRYFRTLGVSEFALTLPVSLVAEDAPSIAMTPRATLIEDTQLVT